MQITYGAFNGAKTITLNNRADLELTLCALGAGIMSVKLPDRDGVKRELTRLSDRGYGNDYNGMTIGRTAGRIANAEFTIGGKKATLERNNKGVDNLHGGTTGLHTEVFDLTVDTQPDYTNVIFAYRSPDGEGGYFGNVDITVTYRVYENEKRFGIIFEGKPDCKTLLNLTNHVYWDMSGGQQPVTEQTMYIGASKVGELNERLIVERIIDCPKQFDFTTPHKIGDYINDEIVQMYTHGYDHPFFLNRRGMDNTACSLYSDLSGIKLSVKTTYPCAVVYGDNFGGYKSVCFECQYHPNGVNIDQADCGVCSPSAPYREITDYAFSVGKTPRR